MQFLDVLCSLDVALAAAATAMSNKDNIANILLFCHHLIDEGVNRK